MGIGGGLPRSVVVLCVYTAPEALERVARCPVVEYVVVGRRAGRCDERGYLIPYTNGDIGDKIYGECGGRRARRRSQLLRRERMCGVFCRGTRAYWLRMGDCGN